jgi:PAS domain S-box-containing protein
VESATIVVLGGSEQERGLLASQLVAAGLAATAQVHLPVGQGTPALLVATGADAAQVVAAARDVPSLADVPILAIAPAVSPGAVAAAHAAGAPDVVRLPALPALLATRCRNLMRLERRDPAAALAKINDVLAMGGDDADALVQVLAITAGVLGFERASLIAHIEGSDHAFVIAANDSEPSTRFALAIAEYPEVAECIRTLAPVLIDDVRTHPLTAPIAAQVSESVRAIAVIPVQWRGRALGAILLRKETPGVGHLGPRNIELGKLIASLTAAHLRHGAVLESLRDQTHRLSRARYEAERRLRGIDSLKEHFEAGADGVIVLDEGGHILYVNRVAERITGYAGDGILGCDLGDLVANDEQRAVIADALARVLAGVNIDAFDLQLSTTSGSPAWVSVSTSTLLAGTGAVIFAFRDVTAERALEQELRSTKEFLERLIDSTVDAIIAADLDGQIILFNQGAERLFGYRARDVIGRLPVDDLYEEGGAKQIMRMLRSTSYGGVGRIEQTRREVRIAGAETVPVSMTASTIYEGGREVATVGILTDLRERIRMEQRLLDAQQKLRLSEKQALVAELAGAAAHELNQPLTSIMGYAQLIERQSAKDAVHLRAVRVILSEAERMAGIVKKIGKITKYETTDYVGTARMLDLDRASAGAESDPAIPLAADDYQTGEFYAVAPGSDAVHQPTLAELRELDPDGPHAGGGDLDDGPFGTPELHDRDELASPSADLADADTGPIGALARERALFEGEP